MGPPIHSTPSRRRRSRALRATSPNSLSAEPLSVQQVGGGSDCTLRAAKRFGVETSGWKGKHYGTCKETHAEVPQEHYGDRKEAQGIHGRGTSREPAATRPR